MAWPEKPIVNLLGDYSTYGSGYWMESLHKVKEDSCWTWEAIGVLLKIQFLNSAEIDVVFLFFPPWLLCLLLFQFSSLLFHSWFLTTEETK